MLRRVEPLQNVLFRESVRLILVALASLVLDHTSLEIHFRGVDLGQQESLAVGIEPQHQR